MRIALHPYNYYYWIPVCWIGLFLCLFTFTTALISPKMRKFPNCVSVWPTILDFIQFIREISKWNPIGAIQETMVYHSTKRCCTFLFVLNTFVDTGAVICNLSIALIVYLSVVKKIDMSYDVDKRWFWGIVSVFWIYTLVITITLSCLGHFEPVKGGEACPATNPKFYFVLGGQWAIVIIITSVVIGLSLKYITEVLRATRKEKSISSQRTSIMIHIRFILIIFVQTIPHFMENLFFAVSVNPTTDPNRIQLETRIDDAAIFMIPIFYFTDCIIVLVGNTDLRIWIRTQFKTRFGLISYEPPLNKDDVNVPLSLVVGPRDDSSSHSSSLL